MVIALFAALIVPWFVNWNSYRASFEAEASRILGHRVHVEGNAHATILPSPSLTFTKVEVDDENGRRMMDVARFNVVIELMPLLQGKIQVVSMTLDKPVINVAVDAAGNTPWLTRAKLHEPFDPDKVALDNVTIRDGAINYSNAQTGVSRTIDGIAANASTISLSGPWHVDGFYRDDGKQADFRIATGRVLGDGTIRIKADVNPVRWPVTVDIDGPVGIDPVKGLTWRGTYDVSQVVATNDKADNGDAGNGPTGWRSQGAFTLTSDRLEINKAVLSNGPADRPLSVAGTLSLDFGRSPSFAATAEARQIDVDRTLGKGPGHPIDVSAAADSFVGWLRRLPVPAMPGSIRFNVPAIVVGGRIVENVAFTAAPADGGWRIASLTARLPGQATLTASGLLNTRRKFGFDGQAHLAVDQPSTFATWWRGGNEGGGGRLLAPFDLSGHAQIGPNLISFDRATARIDNATITGHFDWGEVADSHRRELSAVLDAKGLIDFVQLKALAELLVGHNLTNTGTLADDYRIQVKADALAYQDLTVKGIEVNAVYSKDALTVTALQVADIGGAKIDRTYGKIENLSGDPRGNLVTTLDAPTLNGLARLADRFLPASGFTRWLDAAAPALGEAVVTAKITAPLPDGSSGFAFTIDNGVAASTAFNVSASFAGGFAHWRTKPADITATLDSPDSAGLLRQFGLDALAPDKDSGGHIEVLQSKGIPADGLDTVVAVDLAGTVTNINGKLKIGADLAPSFDGSIGVSADRIAPIVAMAGLDVPLAEKGTKLSLDGHLTASGSGLALAWKDATFGPAIVGGDVTLASDGSGGWRIGGSLVTDRADLGWISALSLGFAPQPTGDPAEPWSHLPFSAPGYGLVSGKLQVAADRLAVGNLDVTGTAFTLALQPQHIDVDLTKGQLNGGTVTGGVSIDNVGGNVTLSGRFDLKGAALQSFVWRRDGRSVATGTLDLSANFQSTGRSPAGLVSTMTGGGVLSVSDGLARYINPGTVRQIVRASDLGQQYSEDALRADFRDRIDADNLAFKGASSPFAIVAGAVRLKSLMVKTAGLAATGNAVIDFNTMTLDSDWNLAFDPVDDKVKGDAPEAGIVFHGPIAAPSRTIDVLPLAAYLNEREAARMNEIIALDAATRAEKQRLSRLVDKITADDAQRAEDARIAAAREAARRAAAAEQSARLEAFHANRALLVEKRHVEALAEWAAGLLAQQTTAESAAADATDAASQARLDADAAAQALTEAQAADKDASGNAATAASDLTRARAEAQSTSADAARTANAASQAKQVLADAQAAETAAQTAANEAARQSADAAKALQTATGRASDAATAADKARTAAVAAAAQKDKADKAAATAADARNTAQASLAAAEDAVKSAQATAQAATTRAASLSGEESDAAAAKTKADAAAKSATEAATAINAVRDGASTKLQAAKRDAAAKQKAADAAGKVAQQSADLARTMTDGAGGDAQATAAAQAQQTAADLAAQQAAAKQSVADEANRILADAQAAFDQAQGAAADAATRAQAAAAAASAADARAEAAAAAAKRGAAARQAALADLDQKTAARDAAKTALAAKVTAAGKAATAASAADQAAAETAAVAGSAEDALRAALADKAAAEKAASERAVAASEAAKAAQAATAKQMAATAAAKAAADKADAAANAAAEAARTLSAKAAANTEAASAAAEADKNLAAATAAAADTAAKAKKAEAAAAAASARAKDAASAAEMAQQAATEAAQNAPDVGPIAVPALPPPDSAAPVAENGKAAAEAAATPPVPRPSPRSVPPPARKAAPKAIPKDQPLLITPPQY